MNVVFLLLTTAVSAGADPAPANPPAATIPAPVASSCGCGCATDCCEKPSFFERCRARFSKSSCCEESCCSAPAPCCKPAPCCAPAPCCKPASCCDSCCEKPSFLDRLRARFAKHDCDCGCDTCGGCGGCGATTVAPAATDAGAPEKLKKMPKGDGDNKGNQTIAPAAPTLTPTGAKIETEAKNPF